MEVILSEAKTYERSEVETPSAKREAKKIALSAAKTTLRARLIW